MRHAHGSCHRWLRLLRCAHFRRAREQSCRPPADCGSTLQEALRDLRVGTVIHTAGPFQGQDYTVARAAIDAGCHYVDLADGRQFVTGIVALDAAAKSRGLTSASGASSVPALSSAVVDHYLPEFKTIGLHTDRHQLRRKSARSRNRPRGVQLRGKADQDSARRVMEDRIRLARPG
jgi:hypothetical protein